MGFLSGSMTFQRYWITQDPTEEFGAGHLEVLEEYQIGAIEAESSEQPRVGFVGGAHLLDTQFDLGKNQIGDALHFGVRIDTNQVPSALRKAWLQMELAVLAAESSSGKVTKAQRQEAKEAVEARCEEEARSGKFRRMQQVPVLWDAFQNVVYLGGTSTTANELCTDLLQRAFGLELDRVTSGKLAKKFATDANQLDVLYETNPASFLVDGPGGVVTWWNGMGENFDYLGNEFLLWLWWQIETNSDTFELADDSHVSAMFTRSLTLACPLGESGRESISADSPIALPEAALAIRLGKLPRKAGLTLVRNDEQFDLALQAEEFTVGSAKMTHIGGDDSSDNPLEDRIAKLRELNDTIDLLYGAFCQRRIGKAWKGELKKLQDWLAAENPRGQRKPAA